MPTGCDKLVVTQSFLVILTNFVHSLCFIIWETRKILAVMHSGPHEQLLINPFRPNPGQREKN